VRSPCGKTPRGVQPSIRPNPSKPPRDTGPWFWSPVLCPVMPRSPEALKSTEWEGPGTPFPWKAPWKMMYSRSLYPDAWEGPPRPWKVPGNPGTWIEGPGPGWPCPWRSGRFWRSPSRLVLLTSGHQRFRRKMSSWIMRAGPAWKDPSRRSPRCCCPRLKWNAEYFLLICYVTNWSRDQSYWVALESSWLHCFSSVTSVFTIHRSAVTQAHADPGTCSVKQTSW